MTWFCQPWNGSNIKCIMIFTWVKLLTQNGCYWKTTMPGFDALAAIAIAGFAPDFSLASCLGWRCCIKDRNKPPSIHDTYIPNSFLNIHMYKTLEPKQKSCVYVDFVCGSEPPLHPNKTKERCCSANFFLAMLALISAMRAQMPGCKAAALGGTWCSWNPAGYFLWSIIQPYIEAKLKVPWVRAACIHIPTNPWIWYSAKLHGSLEHLLQDFGAHAGSVGWAWAGLSGLAWFASHCLKVSKSSLMSGSSSSSSCWSKALADVPRIIDRLLGAFMYASMKSWEDDLKNIYVCQTWKQY